MQRPEVILENADEVYAYYLAHQQNRLQSKASYAYLARKYAPRVTYAPGAKEQLRDLIASNTRLIISIDHLSQDDPYTVAATAWRSPLRPTIGRTRVLAKDELFLEEKQRKKVDMMGGIPVFRGKNHGIRAVNAAGQTMMDLCAERMRRGDNLAIFPEGTCNLEDPTRVQAVGSGIGHVTSRSMKLGVRPALIFLGLSYGPGETTTGASMFFDSPVVDIPDRPGEITRLVRARMQDALDRAVENY
ncbi:lysophospholipid acyltransferase family protein [Antrihabitans cavernicola]|uniref:1-acyl-sn-glycerol-3-phosphate acyltransferase n=1 Tax=Antrihabitans cavernicola TaxID=2495913 RepID=A0A5A7S3D7_9NOCA|nr:1-acyl-sn-glycerol-3-phosphate acyltransferase [Spelaeibacter cavernicola]KAA0019405.1 1-acyl-sn-glycerol-3-phosphate acyltransferase [Spelaeibacter cavernicola]